MTASKVPKPANRHTQQLLTQHPTTRVSTQPEPRPVLIYKHLDQGGVVAKYGRFEGRGSSQRFALDDLLFTMYSTVSNIVS